MENAETILVIILSSFLALFLLLAIISAYKFIKLLKHLEHLSERADVIAEKAENVAQFIASATGPALIGKLFTGLVDSLSNKKSKK